jgi:hypothetical protein
VQTAYYGHNARDLQICKQADVKQYYRQKAKSARAEAVNIRESK